MTEGKKRCEYDTKSAAAWVDQASPRGIPFHEDRLSGYNIRRSMLLSGYSGDNEREKVVSRQ